MASTALPSEITSHPRGHSSVVGPHQYRESGEVPEYSGSNVFLMFCLHIIKVQRPKKIKKYPWRDWMISMM